MAKHIMKIVAKTIVKQSALDKDHSQATKELRNVINKIHTKVI